ncbi:uncharacterized protein LACBIDRAFT_310065 [Laccaria bicolor S238N-H82]|uniref:Predicted protein n=1 Tax=Laccaria bicolor (strain S238N-H82 / ATCC MYA-4686) TaxID=486041 RepID=B0DTK6_LACBS|nr:uncharacterized protein LACBIDRAFT_310065 [Laccaria bicolor S238N-H82]EDR02077.1 predicted protein [Laccaria bicolor S238N-H82]|eukprot:XP_001887234.1 predicted protein [Laccaria bicolor S238N-H82]
MGRRLGLSPFGIVSRAFAPFLLRVAHQLLISGRPPATLRLTLASGTTKRHQKMLFSKLRRSESVFFNGQETSSKNIPTSHGKCDGKLLVQSIN